MPEIQDGWIVVMPARNGLDAGNKTFRVRLTSGKTYPFTQGGTPIVEGQKVLVVRFGASLAVAD